MKQRFSLSEWLFSLGEGICFAPRSEFSSSYEERKKRMDSFDFILLPYTKKVKNALAKTAEQSAVLGIVRYLIRRFFALRIRSLGVFFFTCGLLQIVSYFALSLFPDFSPASANLLFGVVQILATLLCSFTRGDVADALKRSFFFRAFLSPFLGVKEWQIPGGKGRENPVAMLLWGAFAGILSIFVSPVLILQGGAQVVLALFLLFSPEAGLLLSLSVGLFLPRSFFFFLVGISFASFLCKCSVGKRSLTPSFTDLFVFAFLSPFGVLHGEWKGVFFLFMLYFLTSCLIRTLSDLSRLFGVVTFASFVMASFLLAREGLKLFFPTRFASIQGLETFFFVKPDETVGCIFALALPMVLSTLRGERSRFRRSFSYITCFLLLFALFVHQNSAVWLAAVLGVLIFFLFSYRASLIWFVAISLLTGTILNFLPKDRVIAIQSLFGFGSEHLHSPVEGYSGMMEMFSDGGIWTALFFLTIAYFAYQVVRFRFVSTRASAYPYVLGAICSVAVFFALSVQSVLPDYRALILFLPLLAVPGSASRASVREEVRLTY